MAASSFDRPKVQKMAIGDTLTNKGKEIAVRLQS